MGLTYREAVALGIGHLHPDARHAGLVEGGGWMVDGADGGIGSNGLHHPPTTIHHPPEHHPPEHHPPSDGMNWTERRFLGLLARAIESRAIVECWREPMKLRLAGHTFYTPDFAFIGSALIRPGGMPLIGLTFVEVKGGYAREDSLIKLKVAADVYPCFGWLLVYAVKGHGWRVHRVTERGIGVDPVKVPWITGA